MGAVTSVKYIDVPGIGRLDIREGAKVMLGGLVSQAEAGDGSLAGTSDKFEIPSIECTAIHKPGLSLVQLSQLKGVNVTVQSSAGSAWVLQEAAIEGGVELTGADIPLRFVGTRLDELKA